MRLVNYQEREQEKEFTMTIKLTDREWKKFDIRAFDVLELHTRLKQEVNPKVLQTIIYDHYGLTDTLKRKMCDATEVGRIRKFVDIRRICYYFLREYTDLTYSRIGELYGQDHATAMHHRKKVTDWIDVDEQWNEEITELRSKIIDRLNIVL